MLERSLRPCGGSADDADIPSRPGARAVFALSLGPNTLPAELGEGLPSRPGARSVFSPDFACDGVTVDVPGDTFDSDMFEPTN